MPFDPAWPPQGAPLASAPMRAQFNALHDEILAVPAGPPGPQGPPFASAVVDSVTTGGAGSNANVSVSFDGTNVHFSFDIPRGDTGSPGEVSFTDLNMAMGLTAQNPSSVSPLPPGASLATVAAKVNELIAALARV